jgi:hypothetical protein
MGEVVALVSTGGEHVGVAEDLRGGPVVDARFAE